MEGSGGKMVRNYKRKTEDRWTKEDLLNALMCIKNNELKINDAARTFGISRATLYRQYAKFIQGGAKCDVNQFRTCGGNPILTKVEEDVLEKTITDLRAQGFTVGSTDIKRICFEYCDSNGIPNQFNSEKRTASDDWYYGFLKRHPSVGRVKSNTNADGTPDDLILKPKVKRRIKPKGDGSPSKRTVNRDLATGKTMKGKGVKRPKKIKAEQEGETVVFENVEIAKPESEYVLSDNLHNGDEAPEMILGHTNADDDEEDEAGDDNDEDESCEETADDAGGEEGEGAMEAEGETDGEQEEDVENGLPTFEENEIEENGEIDGENENDEEGGDESVEENDDDAEEEKEDEAEVETVNEDEMENEEEADDEIEDEAEEEIENEDEEVENDDEAEEEVENDEEGEEELENDEEIEGEVENEREGEEAENGEVAEEEIEREDAEDDEDAEEEMDNDENAENEEANEELVPKMEDDEMDDQEEEEEETQVIAQEVEVVKEDPKKRRNRRSNVEKPVEELVETKRVTPSRSRKRPARYESFSRSSTPPLPTPKGRGRRSAPVVAEVENVNGDTRAKRRRSRKIF